ncbi:UNVERIFIED_CONTAM: hypothetical protein K2H54_023268 [Gekko kuhli]
MCGDRILGTRHCFHRSTRHCCHHFCCNIHHHYGGCYSIHRFQCYCCHYSILRCSGLLQKLLRCSIRHDYRHNSLLLFVVVGSCFQ